MEKDKILFDVLYERRSIRRYVENKQVEKDKIVRLLQAAMAAPSACNQQPWEFIVITDTEGVKRLKETIGESNGRHYNAPAALAVCENTQMVPWDDPSISAMDCSAAIENLLLAATVLELGAVWIGDFNEDMVRALLDIPEHVRVISLVLFGYPAEQKKPRTQYRDEAVHWQKYDLSRKHASSI